ncbi:MAG: rod shape-determining protein MreC [Oscillospiraceae bacterium]|nr:rod shape-determining protein MreC [Oscillospiraceae bacterium]
MGQFFKSVKFKIILCIAGFFLGIALFSVTRDGKVPFASQCVGTVFNPIRQFSNAISDKVGLVIDLFLDSEKYVEENRQLREKVADLNERLIDYEDMKSEVEDLRKFIGIKEENEDFKYSPVCSVISRNVNDPYGTFVIDRGSNDGISLYDPVVTPEGLVGVITEVANTYSTVRTIFSQELSVGVMCVESRDTGIVEGSLTYAEKGQCKMIYIDKENKIKEGDLIITSGNSGQFPQGYIIGNVKETGIEESGLTAYAVIEPAVNPKDVTSVMVIIDFNEKKKEITEGDVGKEITTEPETEPQTEPVTEPEDNYDDSEPEDMTEPEAYSDDSEPEDIPEPEDSSDDSVPEDSTEPENGGDSNAE